MGRRSLDCAVTAVGRPRRRLSHLAVDLPCLLMADDCCLYAVPFHFTAMDGLPSTHRVVVSCRRRLEGHLSSRSGLGYAWGLLQAFVTCSTAGINVLRVTPTASNLPRSNADGDQGGGTRQTGGPRRQEGDSLWHRGHPVLLAIARRQLENHGTPDSWQPLRRRAADSAPDSNGSLVAPGVARNIGSPLRAANMWIGRWLNAAPSLAAPIGGARPPSSVGAVDQAPSFSPRRARLRRAIIVPSGAFM